MIWYWYVQKQQNAEKKQIYAMFFAGKRHKRVNHKYLWWK